MQVVMDLRKQLGAPVNRSRGALDTTFWTHLGPAERVRHALMEIDRAFLSAYTKTGSFMDCALAVKVRLAPSPGASASTPTEVLFNCPEGSRKALQKEIINAIPQVVEFAVSTIHMTGTSRYCARFGASSDLRSLFSAPSSMQQRISNGFFSLDPARGDAAGWVALNDELYKSSGRHLGRSPDLPVKYAYHYRTECLRGLLGSSHRLLRVLVDTFPLIIISGLSLKSKINNPEGLSQVVREKLAGYMALRAVYSHFAFLVFGEEGTAGSRQKVPK